MFVRLIVAVAIMAASAMALPAAALAQNLECRPGDTEVRELDFVGNHTFTDTELGDVIVTTPSAWARRYLDLPFTARRCLDRAEFANDRLRLLLFYRRHGFPQATVDTVLVPAGTGGAVVRFHIREGPSVRLASLAVLGLDSVPNPAQFTGDLPIHAGERFDRTRIDAAINLITRRLRNRGYPAVAARNVYAVDTVRRMAYDSILVAPGAETRFGAIQIAVTPAPHKKQHVPDRMVRHIVGIDSGALFSEQAIIDAQRSLYETDAFTHVTIALDSAGGRRVGRDSIAPVTIALAENILHAARLGGGYGTLDCVRATAELDDYNFLRGARHLAIQGRVSKIGIGRPLNGASDLCPQARRDPYSTRLNYYLGATLRQPVFFGLRTVPTITAYTSRVSEYNAFVRTTAVGGVAALRYQRWARTPVTLGYTLDYGRTEAQPALFCAVFNLCDAEERERVQRTQRLGVFNVVVAHDATNNALAPTNGSLTRFEIRHSSPVVFSEAGLQFNTALVDASQYVALSDGNVLAFHVRGGSVFGRNFGNATGFIPPQERLYAGGPSSVRGFAQNELGASTYIAPSFGVVDTVVGGVPISTVQFRDATTRPRRTVPVGGNSLVVGNVELRLRSPVLPELLQFAVFTDAGSVWNRGASTNFGTVNIKVTPGVQAAALTPVGPARIVVGYNPYRLPNGPIYYESPTANGSLLCVTPGNTLPVAPTSGGGATQVVQASGGCPATYAPPRNRSFFSRLTFGLAIGQAF